MCIGIPMQVVQAASGVAQCLDGMEMREIRTSLVGPLRVGEWVLVFQHDAVEKLDPTRAREIRATLDLVRDAMHGGDAQGAAAFALPSSLSAADLAALTSNAQGPNHALTE